VIKVYHSPRARSVRVIWLLEELGVPYELETMLLGQEAIKSERYRRVHPMSKVPAIEDGDVTLFESGAIVEYLLERHGEGRLQPAVGTFERALYLQWFHFGEATALPPLGDITQHSFLRPESERIPPVVEDGKRRAALVLDTLEQGLTGKSYLCGDAFTAADIMTGYAVSLMSLLGLLGDAHPTVAAYFARLQERPALQTALTT